MILCYFNQESRQLVLLRALFDGPVQFVRLDSGTTTVPATGVESIIVYYGEPNSLVDVVELNALVAPHPAAPKFTVVSERPIPLL